MVTLSSLTHQTIYQLQRYDLEVYERGKWGLLFLLKYKLAHFILTVVDLRLKASILLHPHDYDIIIKAKN